MTCGAVWWQEISCACRFANNIADNLRNEMSVLLQCADDIPWKTAFYSSIEERLPEHLFLDVDVNGIGGSVQKLQEHLVEEYTTEHGEGYRGNFFEYFSKWQIKKRVYRLCNIPEGYDSDWLDFFACYAKESKRRRLPPFLIEFPAKVTRVLPDRLAVFSWGGALNRYDFRLFTSRIADKEGLNDVEKDYLSAFAALLSGTDAEICAEIIEEYYELVFANRYVDILSALDERHAAPDDPKHVLAIYRANKMSEIERRVWEAQLTTFFPRIEKWRARILDRYRDFLNSEVLPNGTVVDPYSQKPITEANDLELTILFHQIAGRYEWNGKTVLSDNYNELKLMYNARNELAHLHILCEESLSRLLELFGTDDRGI